MPNRGCRLDVLWFDGGDAMAEAALQQRVAGNLAGSDERYTHRRLLADGAVAADEFCFAANEADHLRIRRDVFVPPSAASLCPDQQNAVAMLEKSFQPGNDAIACPALTLVKRRIAVHLPMPGQEQAVVGFGVNFLRRHVAEAGAGTARI